VIDLAVTAAGVPAVGYFAQIPHYVSGAYPAAAVELLRAVGRHLGEEIDVRPPGRGRCAATDCRQPRRR
jgi:hypothetical protein